MPLHEHGRVVVEPKRFMGIGDWILPPVLQPYLSAVLKLKDKIDYKIPTHSIIN
jgi:hypothetical protein